MPQGGASGYSPPTSRQEWSGTSVTIASGDSARLTWDTPVGPDTVLSNTNPAIPTVIVAGVYFVQVEVDPQSSLNIGTSYTVLLQLDRNGFNADANMDSAPATAAKSAPLTSLGFAWYIPAGGQVQAWVTNNDTVSRAFAISGAGASHIQRLS